MRKSLSLSVLVMIFLGWGCTEDEGRTIFLPTEEVLYINGKILNLLEGQIADQYICVSNRGFWKTTFTGFRKFGDLPFDIRESAVFELNAEGSYPMEFYKLDPDRI
ncbi:hypothetical protein J2X69_004449 [Algoriphagus sp. 4150]|uniref:hypothetical protein n=1 Tax=Algoriphagus sp. 4150 TaxID=2817756 RepID=UPI00285DA32A|nr:hypothetical protein [Algoriphagus sp. 4150]MDR7132083.1 hypothetical protein [Algoriphagus sp. 4150]